MGSDMADDEKPAHHVYLNAFYMDKYEVTVEQYAKYLEATDMEEPPDWHIMHQPQHQKRPVVNVDWARCCHVLQMGRQAAADGG